MKDPKFYVCPKCGQVIEIVHDKGRIPRCCGEKVLPLEPNSVEASGEKHIPQVKVGDGFVEVNVGSVDHPMEEVHWIEWVELVSQEGVQRKYLNPGEAPQVRFSLDSKPLAVYAFCNLHGLWKAQL